MHAARLQVAIGQYGDAVHDAAIGVVERGIVQHRSIVPDQQISWLPTVAILELRSLHVLRQKLQQRAGFERRYALDEPGVRLIHPHGPPAVARMYDDQRVGSVFAGSEALAQGLGITRPAAPGVLGDESEVVHRGKALDVVLHAWRQLVVGGMQSYEQRVATEGWQLFGVGHGDDGRPGEERLVRMPHIGSIACRVKQGHLFETGAEVGEELVQLRLAEVPGECQMLARAHGRGSDGHHAVLGQCVGDSGGLGGVQRLGPVTEVDSGEPRTERAVELSYLDGHAATLPAPRSADGLQNGTCAAAADERKWCDQQNQGGLMTLQSLLEELLGSDLPIVVDAYDGSRLGPANAPATVHIRNPQAIRRLVTSLGGELGFTRAFVAGEIDIEGDIYAVLALRDRLSRPRPTPALLRKIGNALGHDFKVGGVSSLAKLRPAAPPEEIRLRGHRHGRSRDAKAIASHYDVSNEFYRLFLGPSMTYSCALFESPDDSLEQAQFNKHDLICRKLEVGPGKRLLDIGCGWGGMAVHAARVHGASVVGVTISNEQYDYARKRVVEAGLADRVEIRLQDYRDIDDGPFDAISSVGMFEHVGLRQLGTYMEGAFGLLVPTGRFLNHAITRPVGSGPRFDKNGFINRYVFPDGELLDLGEIVTAMHAAGLEVRHVETLREHYDTTLRHWVNNLEAAWSDAVDEVGEARARVWRLYMAGSALQFAGNHIQVQQVLAVRPDSGISGFGSGPHW